MGKFAEAEKSFRFYKNIKRDDIKAESEFEDLKIRLIKVEKEKENSFNYRDFSELKV